MRYFLSIILGVLISISGPSVAGSDVLTEDGLRALVLQGDIETVETALHAAQTEFEAGNLDDGSMRLLFAPFGTTDPDVIGFVEDWRRAHPGSAYAKTAQAWLLYRAGWVVRGTRFARETYPLALTQHRALHRRSMDLARQANTSAPMLLPASDAILRLGNTGGDKAYAFDVLDRVMAQHPNWGTLMRALDMVDPGWGGTLALGQRICDHYGPMIRADFVDDVRDYCHMELLARGQFRDWHERLLTLVGTRTGWPYDGYRFDAVSAKAAPSQTEALYLRDYYATNEVSNVGMAERYDRHIAMRMGYPLQTDVVMARAKAQARRTLEHDPYNLTALNRLLRPSGFTTRTETGIRVRPDPDNPTPEDKADYLARRVIAAPYEPDHWQELAAHQREMSIKNGEQAQGLLGADDYMINAIHYGQHAPDRIEAYMSAKVMQLAVLFEVEKEGLSHNGWDVALQKIDRTTDIVCPILRAGRLLIAVRQLQSDGAFDAQSLPHAHVFVGLRQEAKDNGHCDAALNGDIDTLYYQPVVGDPFDAG